MALCAATLQSLWLITTIRTTGYSKLNPITLLEVNKSGIEYSKNNTDHDETKHIASITWFVSKYNKGTYQLLRYPLRGTLLTYWPNLCMVIYSGSICLLHYLSFTTISKFEDPRKFAIATKLVYLYRRWSIHGRTLQKQQGAIFRVFILRASSAPALCAFSLDRSGNPRLPTRSEGGFLDRLQCYWRFYTHTYSF